MIISRILMTGPSDSGKTYFMLENMKIVFTRVFFFITKSPERYNHEFNTEDEIGEIGEYQGGFVVFDDKLDFIQKEIDPFLKKEVKKILDVNYLLQYQFDFPKITEKQLLIFPN